MNIEECSSVFENVITNIDDRKRAYIHYESFTNFFKNYYLLKTEEIKSLVLQLLEEYVLYVNENLEEINRTIAMDIVIKYLMPIGKIYKSQLDFKEIMKRKFALYFSIVIDIILILFGFEKFFGITVPLITIATALSYIIFLDPLIKRGKVFGIFL